MKVIVSNNFAGCICNIKLIKEFECYGAGVTFRGYIETNTCVVEHCKSNGKFTENEINFKIPENTIPSLLTKNFRVFYEIELSIINKTDKISLKTPIIIFNNNLIDFSLTSRCVFDLEIVNTDEFERNKSKVCQILLEKYDQNLLNDYIGYDDNECFTEQRNNNVFDKIDKKTTTLDLALEKDNPTAIKPIKTNILMKTKAALIPPGRSFVKGSSNILETSSNHVFNISTVNSINKNGVVSTTVHITNYLPALPVPNVYALQEEEQQFEIEKSTKKYNQKEIKLFTRGYISRGVVQNNDTLNKQNTNYTDTFNDNNQVFLETADDIIKLLQKVTPVPTFNTPNILKISKEKQSYTIVDQQKSIATVLISAVVICPTTIYINYLSNIKYTSVEVWRQDFENNKLIDTEMLLCVNYDTENCIQKRIQCDFIGFSIKTFIFEIKYLVLIKLNHSEVSIPIKVLMI